MRWCALIVALAALAALALTLAGARTDAWVWQLATAWYAFMTWRLRSPGRLG